jgi:hypothetical protein
MTIASLLRIGAGVIVWALHFAAMYGAAAIACARGAAQALPWLVAATTVAGLVAAGVVVARSYPRRARFEDWLAAAVAASAMLAMAWEAVAMLASESCA